MQCYEAYLNDVAHWRCVPARVWKYTIGGYQVMKKWLSCCRIAAILLLEPALDANYERVKADTYAWPRA
jgi:hypothetical protein